MQSILDYAAAKSGFVEQHRTDHPELVVGSVPGMPRVVGWVFRLRVSFTLANGTPEQVIETFGRVPLRGLEADVLGRFPVAAGWGIRELVVRGYKASRLQRIVALGERGEASILFEGEGDTIGRDRLLRLRRAAIGKTMREVVDALAPARIASPRSGD